MTMLPHIFQLFLSDAYMLIKYVSVLQHSDLSETLEQLTLKRKKSVLLISSTSSRKIVGEDIETLLFLTYLKGRRQISEVML